MDLFNLNQPQLVSQLGVLDPNAEAAAPQGLLDLAQYAPLLSKKQENKLQKFSDIIGAGGTLSPEQEARFGKLGQTAGADFASLLGYSPVTQRYETKFAAPETPAFPTLGATPPQSEPMVSQPWSPSYDDLYEYLKPQQEQKLEKLSDKYSMGLLEGKEGKINKLESLLERGQLGDMESWFSQELSPYSAPSGLDLELPEGTAYEDIAKIFAGNDPMRAFAASEQLGLAPEDIYKLTQGYRPSYYNPVQTLESIQSTLMAGKSDAFDFGLATEYLKNPQDERFVSNPALAQRAQQVVYAYQNPIKEPVTNKITTEKGKEVAGSGQYGYINNAPVLSAKVADTFFDKANKNQVGGGVLKRNADLAAQLGWNPKSGQELNMIQRGASVLGVNEELYTPANLKKLDQQLKEGGYTDSDGRFVEVSLPADLVKASKKLGLNFEDYDSASALYKDIKKSTEGLYQVVGQYRDQWNPEEVAQINDKGNHAAVMYREVNGMLIPVSQPNLFKYQKPKDPLIGGFVGDFIGSVPFLPEIATYATGGNPAVYAALKGAQTAARSGDLKDVAVSAGLAYFVPQVFKEVSGGISELLPPDINPLVADFVTKAGTNAIMTTGIAALTGQDIDIGDIVSDSLLSSGIDVGAGELIKGTSIPVEYRKLASRVITDLLRGQDIEKVITNAAMRGAFTAMKNESNAGPSGASKEGA